VPGLRSLEVVPIVAGCELGRGGGLLEECARAVVLAGVEGEERGAGVSEGVPERVQGGEVGIHAAASARGARCLSACLVESEAPADPGGRAGAARGARRDQPGHAA